MIKFTALLLLVAVPTLAPMSAIAGDHGNHKVKESREAIKDISKEMKGHMQRAMKSGGPIEAIEVCKSVAPAIAAERSTENMEIRRTSLKVRNPANAPDEWERKVLETFEARKAAGEDVKKIDHNEVVELDGKMVFRYMKAIPTQEKPCTICHGTNISPKVTEALDNAYPDDQARGYKAGDIRGAFSIIQPM